MKKQLNAGAETHVRRLVWPGPADKIDEARLRYRPADRLWSFVWWSEEKERWEFNYGTDIAGPTQVPVIEINIAATQTQRYMTGRVLIDEAGNTYLAHKGELKGGRTGVVDSQSFEQHIDGFSKQEALWPDDKIERLFVIGAIGQPSLIPRLRAFVSEAQRLRALAREGRLAHVEPKRPTYKKGSSGETSGTRTNEFTIKRWHELVVDALHTELERRGLRTFTSRYNDMKPDLYSLTNDGRIRHLFEIKTNQDTSALYTAIGQLIVYGAAQIKPPKRFLVIENEVEDLNFMKALAAQKDCRHQFQTKRSWKV